MASLQLGNKEIHYFGEPYSLEEAENIPHLHVVAHATRNQLHAIHSIRETDFQNKLLFEAITHLLNTDMMFRYLVTKDYSLFLSLFPDTEEKERAIQILNELNARDKIIYPPMQPILPKVVKAIDSNVPNNTDQPIMHPLFSWSHPSPNLSSAEKVQHYERELERVNFNYNMEIFRIHNAFAKDDDQYLNRALQIYKKDPVRYKNEISEIENFQVTIAEKHRLIDEINPYKVDGSIDLGLATVKRKEIELLYQVKDDFINKLPIDNKELKELKEERLEKKQKMEEEIHIVNKGYDTEVNSLKAQLQQAKNNFKLEILQNGGRIIEKLRTYDASEEKIDLEQIITKLQRNQGKIKEEKNSEAIQELLLERKNILSELTNRSPSLSSVLKDDLGALDKMILPPKYDSALKNDKNFEIKDYPHALLQKEDNKPSAPYLSDMKNYNQGIHENSATFSEFKGNLDLNEKKPSAPYLSDLDNQQDASTNPDHFRDIKNESDMNGISNNYRNRLHELVTSIPEPNAPPYIHENHYFDSPDLNNINELKSSSVSNGANDIEWKSNEIKAKIKDIYQERKIDRTKQDQVEVLIENVSVDVMKILHDDESEDELHEIATAIEKQLPEIKKCSNYDDVPDDLKTSFHENIQALNLIHKKSKISEKDIELLRPEVDDSKLKI